MQKIKEKMTRQEQEEALETALLEGLCGEAVSVPAAKDPGDAAPLFKKEEHPDTLFDLDGRKKKGLETLFTSGRILKDEDHDFLPDAVDVRFILPEDPSVSVMNAACILACRLGAETTAFEGKLLARKESRPSPGRKTEAL